MRRPTALLPVLVALPLLLAACGSTTPPGAGSGSPSGSPSTSAPSPSAASPVTTLEQARAAWAASAASTGEYGLRIARSCFCAPMGVQTQVRAGTVVTTDFYRPGDLGASVSPTPDPSFPLTVEDLLRVVDGAAGAHRLVVTYSRDGVPLRIDVDAREDVADDEVGYTVVFSTMAGDPRPAPSDGSWRRQDPPSPVPGIDGSGIPETGALAHVDGTGSDAVLRLGLWGSSSCPSVPTTLRPGTTRDGVLAVVVDVDDTQPAGTACTDDYGPTWYAADVPADVAEALSADGTAVHLVLESVLGGDDTGTVARAVDVLR